MIGTTAHNYACGSSERATRSDCAGEITTTRRRQGTEGYGEMPLSGSCFTQRFGSDRKFTDTHIIDVVPQRELEFRVKVTTERATNCGLSSEERSIKTHSPRLMFLARPLLVVLAIEEPRDSGFIPFDCIGVPVVTTSRRYQRDLPPAPAYQVREWCQGQGQVLDREFMMSISPTSASALPDLLRNSGGSQHPECPVPAGVEASLPYWKFVPWLRRAEV